MQALSAVGPLDSTELDIFDQLDDYSLLGVLDHLHFTDLLSLASMNARNRQLIVDHYILPEAGAHATLRVTISGHDLYTSGFYFGHRNASDYSRLAGRASVFAALQVLCPISTDVQISLFFDQHFDAMLKQTVESYVHNHCAGVPQTVEMMGSSESLISIRLPHAKSVFIANPERFKRFDVAKSFPRVERLGVDVFRRFTLAQRLPHLTHFQVQDLTCGHFDLRAFGQKNPQIRSVALELCGQMGNIVEINELFPGLQSLRLKLRREQPTDEPDSKPFFQRLGSAIGSLFKQQKPRHSVESVRFRNVKKYTLDITGLYSAAHGVDEAVRLARDDLDKLSSIAFDKLESLTYKTRVGGNSSAQIDFIAQYKDVKRLDFSSFALRYADMQRLVDSLPKLEDITLAFSVTPAEHFSRLMRETRLACVRVSVADVFREHFIGQFTLPEQWIFFADEHLDAHSILTYKRNRLH